MIEPIDIVYTGPLIDKRTLCQQYVRFKLAKTNRALSVLSIVFPSSSHLEKLGVPSCEKIQSVRLHQVMETEREWSGSGQTDRNRGSQIVSFNLRINQVQQSWLLEAIK